MLGEAELVLRAREGSDAAFSRLVEGRQASVRAFLRRMLGVGWAEADDVAQDVFLAAWAGLSTLRSPEGFGPWLLGIAFRKAQDRLRGRMRGAARDRQWLETPPPPPGVSAEERISLVAALADLPPDQRACVALCLADGWSHAEAAAALNLPLGTVKSHVTRGRARLLQALGGGGDA
jgi:RNA polymerase sigma factor (sigma-70 family)